MKKLSLLALPLALLALGSCDNNNVIEPQSNELGVNAFTGAKHSNRGYTEGSEFYETLTAKLHGAEAERNTESRTIQITGYLTLPNGTQENYFQAATFKQYSNTGIWHNHNGSDFDPIYWPLGGTMDMLAYSVSSDCEAPQSVEWSEKADKVVLKLSNGCSQNDILYAGAFGVSAKQDAGNVDMLFQHAQAWIEFVLTGEAYDYDGNKMEKQIILDGIYLENIYKTGNLSIFKNDKAAMAQWNFDGGVARQDVKVDNEYGVDSLTSASQYLDMLIPDQQQTKILLKYHFAKSEEIFEYEFDLSGEGNWTMGQKYVYTIHLSANEITVTPTVLEWGEQEYTTLHSDKFSMKAIGGATVGKLMVNGEEFDPMKFYKVNDTLTIKAQPNGSDRFRWEDSTTIKTNDLTMTAKEFNEMENPMKVLFYTDKVIPFAYSVSATEKVYFASGNLYCKDNGESATPRYTFDFEEKQLNFRTRYGVVNCDSYDTIAVGSYASTFPGMKYEENTSGLFQWDVTKAVKGGDFGAFGEKASITGTDSDVLDFGKALGEGSEWSTLKVEEWAYLIGYELDIISNIRDHATDLSQWVDNLCGVSGRLMAPDGYKGGLSGGNEEYWGNAQKSGLVFLPAAGLFYDDSVFDVGGYGDYWSSSADDTDAYALDFYYGEGYGMASSFRGAGYSVRLVWR